MSPPRFQAQDFRIVDSNRNGQVDLEDSVAFVVEPIPPAGGEDRPMVDHTPLLRAMSVRNFLRADCSSRIPATDLATRVGILRNSRQPHSPEVQAALDAIREGLSELGRCTSTLSLELQMGQTEFRRLQMLNRRISLEIFR